MPEAAVSSPVVWEGRDGGVVWLRLSRPERRNALSTDVLGELLRSLRRAAEEETVRVVVLASSGPVFSSGHDLRELRAAVGSEPAEDLAACRPIFELCSEMMVAVTRLPKPVIACVQGLATAAGCQLVASCDLVVAARSAAFATPGVDLGLFCSTPAVALARSVGRKAAMEMLLTGERVSAERAYEIGLVNRVVDDAELEEEAQRLAERVASRSSLALRLGKETFYRQIEAGLEEAYRLTSEIMAENLLAHDAQEGIDAFFEKRPAKWEGR